MKTIKFNFNHLSNKLFHSICIVMLLFSSFNVIAEEHNQISDPFEPLNRQVYKFNEVVDENLAIPAAEAWQHLPSPLRIGVDNFFSNLDDIMTIINDLLQFKFEQSVSDTARFVTNSTFGLLGVFDVATDWGMPKHDERFADTLGYWGIDSGPYLVLPFWGPSSVRDAIGLAGDVQVYPLTYYYPVDHRNTLQVLKMVNARSNLLDATSLTNELALDPYSFSRDSYHQYRENRIHDGDVPVEIIDDPSIENLE